MEKLDFEMFTGEEDYKGIENKEGDAMRKTIERATDYGREMTKAEAAEMHGEDMENIDAQIAGLDALLEELRKDLEIAVDEKAKEKIKEQITETEETISLLKEMSALGKEEETQMFVKD